VKPVRHSGSNAVYSIDDCHVGDLWVERTQPGEIHVVFEFNEHDRRAIAAGARMSLVMLSEPIPPIAVMVLEPGQCEPVAEHGWKGQTVDDLPDVLPADWRG
jgi:hypothetical protein